MTGTNTTPRRRRRTITQRTIGVVAYRRVSTDEQAVSGLGLAAQRAAIVAECDRRGLPIVAEFVDEAMSGAKLDRPGLNAALELLDAGGASVLMVSRLDRLSRSVMQTYDVMDRSRRNGWTLVAIDLGTDTGTPGGEMHAGLSAVIAQHERRQISERTKAALEVKKAQGMKLGRPRTLSDDARSRIAELRAQTNGKGQPASWRAIATTMAAEGWPTAHGGGWLAPTVRRIWLSDHADAA